MSSVAAKLPTLMTVEEFLDWPGDGSGRRYDLVDGELRAQDAPSDTHGRIHSNVAFLLTGHLRKKHPSCSVVIGGGVKPRLQAKWNYRIPDLSVTCGRNEKGAREVPDPVIIVELLSPSNRAETWDNVRNYATLPSVSEIVVIDTESVSADVLVLDDKGLWPANPLKVDAGGFVVFASIGFKMPLNEAYRGTHLAIA
jgi:Uma2 family endonuclease